MNMFKHAENRNHLFKRFNRLYPVALLIAAFLFSQCGSGGGGSSSGSTSSGSTSSGSQTPATQAAVTDTGQTASYTTTFGEDNDYTDVPNARSYTDNGDETVTDNVTGLVWEQLPAADDHTTYTWADAQTECENRTTAGYTDWRLPTAPELSSLVDYGTFNPAIDSTYFPNTQSFYYWSSTAHASKSNIAWDVNASDGSVGDVFSKASSLYIRCVRGDRISFGANLTDNGDGTVTDADTGLVWQQLEATHTLKDWEAALTYCEGLDHAGKTDWRLPNINELLSIVDYDSSNPAANTNYFPNTKSDYYSSSNTYANSTTYRWYVHAGNGNVFRDRKTDTDYVRCVRGG